MSLGTALQCWRLRAGARCFRGVAWCLPQCSQLKQVLQDCADDFCLEEAILLAEDPIDRAVLIAKLHNRIDRLVEARGKRR